MKNGIPNKDHVSWTALGIIITILLFVFGIIFSAQGVMNDKLDKVSGDVGVVKSDVSWLKQELIPVKTLSNR